MLASLKAQGPECLLFSGDSKEVDVRNVAGDERDVDYVKRAYRDEALHSVGSTMSLNRFKVLRMSY